MALKIGQFKTASPGLFCNGGECIAVGVYNKSSASAYNGNCVETGVWNKSEESVGNGACIETTADEHVVRVRDTKVARTLLKDHAPTLAFSLPDWEDLVARENEQRAVTAAATGSVIMTHELRDGSTFAQVPTADGGFDWVKSDQLDAVLTFTPAEVDAWGHGAREGEFDLTPELQAESAAQRLAFMAIQGAEAGPTLAA